MGGDNTKTYQQSDTRETEWFWAKIWRPRKHNKKAELINNKTKELEGLEEGLKAEILIDLLKTTQKKIKLENARPWWNRWFLVKEIHQHSRQTSIRNEMPTRSTRTRIDDQRKYLIDPEGPNQKNPPNNYRPIICLPMMWKIWTGQIREKINYSIKSRGLFPKEQKGCRKGPSCTGELLYVDQHEAEFIPENETPKIF